MSAGEGGGRVVGHRIGAPSLMQKLLRGVEGAVWVFRRASQHSRRRSSVLPVAGGAMGKAHTHDGWGGGSFGVQFNLIRINLGSGA